ncbi:cytochrome P450 2U1-like isoform X2 [Styela clava]
MFGRLIQVLFDYANIQSFILFVSVLGMYYFMFRRKKSVCNVPGPKAWPLIGNLPSLSLHSERKLLEWHREFGPVIRVKMPSNEFICLGSMKAVQEAFVKKADSFSDRMQGIIPGITGTDGIIFVDYGTKLKEQRRFALTALKEFGMGRRSIEPNIIEKCEELCDKIETYSVKGTPFAINPMVYETVSSIISQLVFNKNLALGNEGFQRFLKDATEGPKYFAISGIMVFFPLLKKIPPFSWVHQETNRQEKEFLQLLQDQIGDHKRTRDPNAPRDFIDCFLNELDNSDTLERSEELGYTDNQLIGVARDLFLGGSDTTSNSICWAVLYLSRNQEVQAKMYEEISDIVGQMAPSTTMSDKMPYTKAVIQEILRMRPIAPLSLGHLSCREDTIMGYRIPKGTLIAANIFGIQNNEATWPDPDKFDPCRHIDSDGPTKQADTNGLNTITIMNNSNSCY